MSISRPGIYPLLSVFLVTSLAAASSESQDLAYEVDKGMIVDACGGIAGGCREFTLEGTLELRLDPEAGTAAIAAADLRIVEAGADSSRLAIPVDLVAGSLDGDTIHFTTPTDSPETLDWTMRLTDNGLVLHGDFDEGCCDRYFHTFRNISFSASGLLEPSTVLVLNDGRFAVDVRWTDFDGNQGLAKAVEMGDDSGYFWFFGGDNTEVVVKALDACNGFDRFWFFASGLTNLAVEIVVTDRVSGAERVYRNPIGQAFQPILDTDAFATCGAGSP